MTEKQIEIINNLNENVEKLGNKDFDVYFYVYVSFSCINYVCSISTSII